ncbi:Sensory transduction histidine kinase [Caldisalinibacter kiritimatiensis]|uniref:histidine kinase n=1 Tax=Caldisalinibacter kiritimatiensis TaxID=1304284 RepID=R1AT22_9FIRM|nr:Sensory transduction histidine kinase [Caldisalinibacter kiritimatiensis]
MRIDPSFNLGKFLNTTIKSYSEDINSRILILDDDSIVKSDSNDKFTDKILRHVEITNALKGISHSSIHNFEELGYVLYIAVPIKYEGKVIGATFISSSLNDIYDTVGEITDKLRIISMASIFLIAILSFAFANFLSKPIEEFTRAIKKMAKGKLGCKVEIKTNDEFKHLANAFNIMSTKLNEVDIQRKDFVANVSHELRTPLSSIKLLSESLLHQQEEDVNIYREFLKDIDSEIDRLNKIIDDLLVLVDLDKEKLSLNYQTTYINFLLEKIISRLLPLAEKKHIDLKVDFKEKLQIKVDKDKIQQAIINIVHNAIKYTPEGGVVEVSLYSEGEYIVVKVKDNGVGIPKESLPHIFDRFYRVDKARARSTGGTGLGLSIAYQIITLHQGTIEVESEVNKGSTFYIKIPYSSGLGS